MTTQAVPLPLMGLKAGFRRFSVAEYHRPAEVGVLTEDDNLELIEGWLIHKTPRNPPHDGTLSRVLKSLTRLLPARWDFRCQMALTLPDSEPEPDLAIVRERPDGYLSRHPIASEAGLIVEVSDSSLDGDRIDKGRVYARAGIPIYWIVNIPDRQVEVYTSPAGPAAVPAYGQRQDYRAGDQLPFVLDGAVGAKLAVQDLLG
jgi:Uma2 family endonuclease